MEPSICARRLGLNGAIVHASILAPASGPPKSLA
jgi:hypothetical protein